MQKHLLTVLNAIVFFSALQPAAHAQGIVATRAGDGRLVYENAPAEAAKQPAASEPAAQPSGLVYWSNVSNCWKPVPPMNSNSMRAAQSAAEEVRRLIRREAAQNGFAANGNAMELASQQSHAAPEPKPLAKTNSTSLLARSTPRLTRRPLFPAAAVTGKAWIDGLVEQAAVRHAVDPNLVRAIIKVESNFNPQAVSRTGAVGLMQLMPSTAKSLNVTNPFDPAQNVDAGVRHFKQLLDSYDGNVELSLAAYNAGAGAVRRSRGIPNYSETRNYVKRITGLYGGNNSRLLAAKHPLNIKRDAEGHLSISDIE